MFESVNFYKRKYTFSLIILNINCYFKECIRTNKSCSERGSFLAHSSDINDLLEGLDGVLEDWLNRLHDSESSLHIVDLWLHALDGLHLSGDLNEWLSIIESLEDSSGEGFLDVLDGSGLGNSGVSVTSGLGVEGGGEGGGELSEELILNLGLGGGNGGNKGDGGEFHCDLKVNY